jgi:hypothetical protein
MIISSRVARRCVAPTLAERRRRIATEQRESIADIAGLLLEIKSLVGISFADLAAV